MHLIDHSTAAPGGLFTEGNPLTGTEATIVTADWLNAVQLEVANAVEGAGLELEKADNTQLLQAIQALIVANMPSGFTTGDLILTMRNTAAAGWIVCDDGTIGSAASAATSRANADTEALFTLLWNNVGNTYAPVSGGRGASAAADFAANKTIGMTKLLGRALAIAGNGSGLTARSIGETQGAETHLLTAAEIPAHNHKINDAFPIIEGAGWSRCLDTGDAARAVTRGSVNTQNNAGGGGAHNNMQPTAFVYAHIKL